MGLFKKKPTELEPLETCAFCGRAPRLSKCGDQREFLIYLCIRCRETPVQFDEARLTEKGARAIWNQRTKEAKRVLRIAARVKQSEEADQ